MINKDITATYILNQPHTVEHVSSDLLQMSCYGYDFRNWQDQDGYVFQANRDYVFTTQIKELSAIWDKHAFAVRFWQEKNAQTQKLHRLSSVLYKDMCQLPENPTPPERKMRFSKWSVQAGSKYGLQDLQSVSCDMDLIAEFVKQWYVGFKYKNDNTEAVLCQITCDNEERITSDRYPPLANLQKSCYTVSSFDPSEINSVTQDTTVYVQDIPNTLSARYTNSNFRYNGEPHTVSVEAYSKNPWYDGEVIVRYADEDTDWRKNPISKTEKGTYKIYVSLSSQNYFEKIDEVTVVIEDEDAISFYFNNYFDSLGKPVEKSDTLVTPYYIIPGEKIPKAYDTVSSTFEGWYPPEYLVKPTSISNSVSARYSIKRFNVKYFYDNTIPTLSGTSLGEFTVDYGGNAYTPSPNIVTQGQDTYKCDGWFNEAIGRDPSERSIIGNNELSTLTNNISAYAFMRKYHPIKAYMVYGNNVILSSLDASVSSIIDYEYLSSDQIGLSNIQYYEFNRWEPSFDIQKGDGKNGIWRIDKDNYSISAVYTSKSGTLTYHSHYPGTPTPTETYTITVQSNNTEYGTTTGSGTYEKGTSVTITATPKQGYVFTKWDDENTESTRVITVSQNKTYTAVFSQIQPTTCKITRNLAVHSSSNSSVTQVQYGSSHNEKISVEDGYEVVVNITMGGQSVTIAGTDIRIESVTGDVVITTTTRELEKYTVTVSSNDTNMGTVSGGGTVYKGKSLTLSAQQKVGYSFVKWSDNNTENPRTYTPTKNISLTAYFEEYVMNPENTYFFLTNGQVKEYTPEQTQSGKQNTIQIINTNTGQENLNQPYCNDFNSDQIYSIYLSKRITNWYMGLYNQKNLKKIVVPNRIESNYGGFRFRQLNSLQEISSPNGFVFNGEYSSSMVPFYNVPFKTIYLDGKDNMNKLYWTQTLYYRQYNCNGSFTAYFDESTYFYALSSIGWPISGSTYTGRNPMGDDISSFGIIKVKDKMALSVCSENEAYGTTTGTGLYNNGQEVEIRAIPNSGYKFLKWSDNNTDNPRTYTPTRYETLTAYFEVYTINPENTYFFLTNGQVKEYTTEQTKYQGNTKNINIMEKSTDSTLAEPYKNDFSPNNVAKIKISNQVYGTRWGIHNMENLSSLIIPNYNDYSSSPPGAYSTTVTYFHHNPKLVEVSCPNSLYDMYTDGGEEENRFYMSPVLCMYIDNISNTSLIPVNCIRTIRKQGRGYNVGSPLSVYVKESFYWDALDYMISSDNESFGYLRVKDKFALNVVSENEEYGTTTGKGLYDKGEYVKIEAIPNNGYAFVQWNDGLTSNVRYVTVKTYSQYTAYFKAVQPELMVHFGSIEG